MGKLSTIYDVAKLAGTSAATVSRVLSDNSYPVSPATRQKVRDAAARLGYVPNTLAKSLRRSANPDVGVVLPSISNPFYQQALVGISEVLSQNGCNIILCNTMRTVEKEHTYLRQLFERQVKGVILSSVDVSSDLIREYSRQGMRFVLLDQFFDDLDDPGLIFDTYAGAKLAVEHLIRQGHRRIAFGTTSMTVWTRNQMYRGYRDALLSAGIAYDPALVFECPVEDILHSTDQDLGAGRNIALAYLDSDRSATAMLCVNDMIAIGVIKTLHNRGVRIPEDLSLIGFDDIPIAASYLPSLTTVSYPAAKAGRLAAMLLNDPSKTGAQDAPLTMNLAPRLILRDTVKKLD